MQKITHAKMFENIPFGRTTERRWAAQPAAVLDAAAEKLADHGAEPWVFTGDAQTFWQFARGPERAAFKALSAEEHAALLGQWNNEEFYPETFGYEDRE